MNFGEAKGYLEKTVNGSSVFDHISEVLLKILTERPDDAVAIFEQISSSVKQETFTPESSTEGLSERVAQYVKSIQKLHASGESEEEPEDGEQDEPLADPRPEVLADLDEQQIAWSAAGVAVGSEDLFKIQLSLARLAGADSSIDTLRLWGKLQGRSSDYWVAEGTGGADLDEGEEEREDPEAEANKHTYWVSSHPGGSWTQLPPLRAQAVVRARQIKRFLTGNLDSSVVGYPKFPGTERDYVRALIALVNAGCAVAPKGYFVADDDGAVNINDEFEMPSAGDLADATAWEAYSADFSSLGRVMPVVTSDEEGNEISSPEGWEFAPLREASPDDWAIRPYPQTLQGSKASKVVLRSNTFPGAFAVASPSTGTWTNIYVGFGHASSAMAYTPPMPPPIQKEFDVTGLREQQDITEDPSPPEEAKEEEE